MKKLIIAISVCFIIIILYGYFIEPNLYQVKTVTIKSSELKQCLGGFNIVHISDLHFSKFGKREQKIIELLEKLDPDIVFITGDFIAYGASFESVYEFLEELHVNIGVWGVLGNSDWAHADGSCDSCKNPNSKVLKTGGSFHILRNESYLLHLPISTESKNLNNHKTIALIGVDDAVTGKADLEKSMKNVPADCPKILLSHSPALFQASVEKGIDLVLSGHTHGGQFFFAPLLRKLFERLYFHDLHYLKGLYSSGKTKMYVNSGIGTSAIPIRIGVRPEIVLLEFK